MNPLGHVTTLRGQILVSRTDDDPVTHLLVCTFQNVPVCTGTTPTCVYTCGRVAGTHGDVLNVHTGFFQRVSHTHTPHHTTPHHTTPHTHTTTTTNNHSHTRQRQRQRHNNQLAASFRLNTEKTHQVQTQQGLTDSSFFVFSVVVHGRFLSW